MNEPVEVITELDVLDPVTWWLDAGECVVCGFSDRRLDMRHLDTYDGVPEFAHPLCYEREFEPWDITLAAIKRQEFALR